MGCRNGGFIVAVYIGRFSAFRPWWQFVVLGVFSGGRTYWFVVVSWWCSAETEVVEDSVACGVVVIVVRMFFKADRF